MELQELISRARFIFNGAPKRLEVFLQVNGRKNAKEIAKSVRKSLNSTLNDLKKLSDIELIATKTDANGKIIKKNGSLIYEKVPLARQIPASYFKDDKKPRNLKSRKTTQKKNKNSNIKAAYIPNENEILDICRNGETQIYEFKTQGTDTNKITKEIVAFSNTKLGGVIFYGVEDDGTIIGTDKTRQQLDQSVQNSIKHNISPPAVVNIVSRKILGQEIVLICIQPWNRKNVYHYDGKVLIRKGTNVLGVTADESKKLHKGEYIL